LPLGPATLAEPGLHQNGFLFSPPCQFVRDDYLSSGPGVLRLSLSQLACPYLEAFKFINRFFFCLSAGRKTWPAKSPDQAAAGAFYPRLSSGGARLASLLHLFVFPAQS
jgi:hypothetical protein